MNVFYALLLSVALVLIQVLIGGSRLLFALPAYGILAVAALGSIIDLRRAKPPANLWCLVSSAAFFGYVLIRAAFSPVAYLAWSDGLTVLGALMVYLITACYLTDSRRRLWVLSAVLLLAAVDLVVGARQFAGDDKTTVFNFLRPAQYAGRASGLYICPNHLAGFLEVVICLSLSMALWSRTKSWQKLLFGYTTLCCMAGLLLTGSRGGYLSVAFGLLVLVVLGLVRVRITSPERFGWSVAFVLAAGIGVSVAASAAFSHSHVLEQRTTDVLKQGDARSYMWASAVREFQEAPILGTGSGTFLYYGRRFRDPVLQRDPIMVHNDYLQLLAEYGIIGAAVLLPFLATHLGVGGQIFWRQCRRSAGQGGGGGSNAVAWNIGALSAVACLMVHSVVDFNLHIPANCLLLAFVFGILANPGRNPDLGGEQVVRVRPLDLLPRLALPVIGLTVLGFGMPKLAGEWYAEQARVALRDKNNAAALDSARRGVEHEQGNPLLYGYLGRARLGLAGPGPDTIMARSFREAAVTALREAVRLSPQDSSLQVYLGEAYTRLGDFADAEQTFLQALFWDPNSSFVLTYYGFYLQQRGLEQEARVAYQRATGLDSNPDTVNNLEQLGRRGNLPLVPANGTESAAPLKNEPTGN